MRKIFLIILLLAVFIQTDISADQRVNISVAESLTPSANDVVLALTPLIVYLVTWLVRSVFTKLPGWVIITIIVPVVSVLTSWVTHLIVIDVYYGFFMQVLLGLLAVFLNELIKQLKQGNTG